MSNFLEVQDWFSRMKFLPEIDQNMILQWKASTCRITLLSILTAFIWVFFIVRVLFSGFSAPAKNRSTVKRISSPILESVPKDYGEGVKKKPDLWQTVYIIYQLC